MKSRFRRPTTSRRSRITSTTPISRPRLSAEERRRERDGHAAEGRARELALVLAELARRRDGRVGQEARDGLVEELGEGRPEERARGSGSRSAGGPRASRGRRRRGATRARVRRRSPARAPSSRSGEGSRRRRRRAGRRKRAEPRQVDSRGAGSRPSLTEPTKSGTAIPAPSHGLWPRSAGERRRAHARVGVAGADRGHDDGERVPGGVSRARRRTRSPRAPAAPPCASRATSTRAARATAATA